MKIKEAFKKANVPEGAEIFVKEILKPKEQVGLLLLWRRIVKGD